MNFDEDEWVKQMCLKYKATRTEARHWLYASASPREAEFNIKIAAASRAVKAYRIKLTSGKDNIASDMMIDDPCCEVEAFIRAAKKTEPKCTCDSKALFDQGCRCEYAQWKKGI